MVAQLVGLLGTTVIIAVGLKAVQGIDTQSKRLLRPLKSDVKFNPLKQARRVTRL